MCKIEWQHVTHDSMQPMTTGSRSYSSSNVRKPLELKIKTETVKTSVKNIPSEAFNLDLGSYIVFILKGLFFQTPF